jgi:hypothetical protein
LVRKAQNRAANAIAAVMNRGSASVSVMPGSGELRRVRLSCILRQLLDRRQRIGGRCAVARRPDFFRTISSRS